MSPTASHTLTIVFLISAFQYFSFFFPSPLSGLTLGKGLLL